MVMQYFRISNDNSSLWTVGEGLFMLFSWIINFGQHHLGSVFSTYY